MLSHWSNKIESLWGADVELTRLDGELDLNLLARTPTGEGFVCKVMRAGCSTSLVEMQCLVTEHIQTKNPDLPVPVVLKTKSGKPYEMVQDEKGEQRIVWAIQFLSGQSYGSFTPKSTPLIFELGQQIARLNLAMEGFEHPSLPREFPWQLMQANWIQDELAVINDAARRDCVQKICADFQHCLSALQALPSTPIHNDINDQNLLISASLGQPASITGLIDFGDVCSAPRICELAIAAAYLVLDHDKPVSVLENLVSGYHSVSPLTGDELELFYPLLKMRLAVSLVTSTKVAKERPDDPYVVISQAPAWRFLESKNVNAHLIAKRLRAACKLALSDSAPSIRSFLDDNRGQFASVLGCELQQADTVALSVSDSSFPQNPLALSAQDAECMNVPDCGDGVRLGLYGEPRLIYGGEQFSCGEPEMNDRRTVHMGVDLFAPAGTAVYAPLEGVVKFVANQSQWLDYGGLIVLEHQTPDGHSLCTLYGHLDPATCEQFKPGQAVKRGDQIGQLGRTTDNGGWAPHLHFQLGIVDEHDGLEADWPGVVSPDERAFWAQLFPNPAALLNLNDEQVEYQCLVQPTIHHDRQQHFGANLSLSYQRPLMFLRGYKHYLFDQWGRAYLDAYNNVPHVGHANPRIQAVVSEQLRRMNSNTRYLHPAQTDFARALLAKLPNTFEVCYFVNSGSEANELALRLARAHTGGKDIITPDHGYHGNTTGTVDISAYKFNGKGGEGQPDWVQLVEAPDVFRGRYRREDPQAAQKYADQVDDAISRIEQRGGTLSGFIAETFPSVGGQIIPPEGYFQHVYEKVRAAGGVCIADEVQTGLGRLGEFYFAFEQQNAPPDVVVLGKPIGNGHPMGVVITTRDIAQSFAEGPEFFSTFGGSTLSCMVGNEVLSIVDDEQLQEKASLTGAYLLDGLRDMQSRHTCIGDVRGIGLFIGVELVVDRVALTPATDVASYLVNRLREQRILVGVEGPKNNILKIRPPLTIDKSDIDRMLFWIDAILSESAVAAG